MSNEIIRANGEVVPTGGALMPVVSIDQMLQRKQMLDECVRRIMHVNQDYGVIPGTDKNRKDGEKPKMTLLKPGAEKLCTLFGLTPDFQEDKIIADFEKGLFFFSYRCVLLSGAMQEMNSSGKVVTIGRIVGTGIGSANSREKKYRRDSRTCPICGKATIKKSRYAPRDDPNAPPGWYCHGAVGGCGQNFAHDDPAVTEQQATINPDEAAELVNTLQKMACKRAMTAAVLIATNASETFSQDFGEEDAPARHEQPRQAPPQQQPKPEPVTPDQKDRADADLKMAAMAGTQALVKAWTALPTAFKHALAGDGKACPQSYKDLAAQADKVKAGVKQGDTLGAEELNAYYAALADARLKWPSILGVKDLNLPADLQPKDMTRAQYAAVMQLLRDEIAENAAAGAPPEEEEEEVPV